MDNPDARRYREAEVALWLRPETYRGFVRVDGLARVVNRVRHWDRIEPFLPREEAERLARELASSLSVRWDGDAIVAELDAVGRVRVEPNEDGLYGVGALHDFRSGIQWTEPFPYLPHGELDPATIVELLDTPLPSGVHPRNRQPVWDELHRRAPAAALVDASSRAETVYARERLCILLAHHSRPRECLPALGTLVSFLNADDDSLRSSAATAIRQLVARSGQRAALAAFPALASALRHDLDEHRHDDARVDVEAALGALEGRAPFEDVFVRQARRALDFLVDEYGFAEPTIDDGGWGTDVVYRTDEIGVVARAEWRDRYVEVLLTRLQDGDLPMYLGNETTRWVPADLAAGVDIPTSDADSDRLPESFDVWAEALRRCEKILGGDVDAFERAVEGVRAKRLG